LALLHQLRFRQAGRARFSGAAMPAERSEGQFGPQARRENDLLRSALDLRQYLTLAPQGRPLPSRRSIGPPVGRSAFMASSSAISRG